MEEARNNYLRLLRRQQCEKRELQAHVLLMNSEAQKNAKKRKQLHLDELRLETELEQKHRQELEQFRDTVTDSGLLQALSDELARMELGSQRPRFLKAHRRCERKAGLSRDHKLGQAPKEPQVPPHEEIQKLAAILAARNLEIKDVPADGHCMYRAIQDQLSVSMSVESLRARTANYLRKHMDDFLPFLSDPESGDPYTREDFLNYCDDIVYNALWGGQIELRALSHILKTPIEVIQADSPVLVMGGEYTRKPITLVYTRYACDLGEHYNSVKPLEAGAVGGASLGCF